MSDYNGQIIRRDPPEGAWRSPLYTWLMRTKGRSNPAYHRKFAWCDQRMETPGLPDHSLRNVRREALRTFQGGSLIGLRQRVERVFLASILGVASRPIQFDVNLTSQEEVHRNCTTILLCGTKAFRALKKSRGFDLAKRLYGFDIFERRVSHYGGFYSRQMVIWEPQLHDTPNLIVGVDPTRIQMRYFANTDLYEDAMVPQVANGVWTHEIGLQVNAGAISSYLIQSP